MTINFYNSEKILRLTPLIHASQKIADEILDHNVRVFPKLENVKVQHLSDLWEMKFEISPSTYALYVYALYPLSYLLNAYELTCSEKYLDQAILIAIDFLSWEAGNKNIAKKRERILFGDHAVSNRTQALCYLICCLKSANRELPRELVAALIRNGLYLADSNNYSQYNHGLMMDLALLGLLNTFQGLEIEHPSHLKQSLISRLRYSITRDLTEDGVHIENSPGYHFWMTSFLNKITSSLIGFDRDLYHKAKSALSNAAEYAMYITRPDGSVPAIGDTHANVKAKPSRGICSKYFCHSNQVVFRSLDDSVWAHFSSGYKTSVHKHCDNGSFNLFFDGLDIFIDPGFINYENEGDAIKIKHACSHNTVKPIGMEQKLVQTDLQKTKYSYSKNLSSSRIVGYLSRNNVESAIAHIGEYGKHVFIERQVSFFKPNVFLIEDRINDKRTSFEQFFQLSSEVTIESTKEKAELYDANGRHIASILSTSKSPIITEEAFFSKGFNRQQQIKRLRIISSGQQIVKTLVVLHRKDEVGSAVKRLTSEYITHFDASSIYNEIVAADHVWQSCL